MSDVKVLIVDCVISTRHFLSRLLKSTEGIEVVSTAISIAHAMDKIRQHVPDIVILGEYEDESYGDFFCQTFKDNYPRLTIISCTELPDGSKLNLPRNLQNLVSEVISKPKALSLSSLDDDDEITQWSTKLIKAIKSNKRKESKPKTPPTTMKVAPVIHQPVIKSPHLKPRVLLIGSSTGGPNVLKALIQALPANFPVPIFIVQHMPPNFTRLMAERINENSALLVREAIDGEIPVPGVVYIAPGALHMKLVQEKHCVHIRLTEDECVNHARPAVDVLFQTAADIYENRTVGVVLTGMGCDGLAGARSIAEYGGFVYVQDQESSVVWGMAGSIAKAHLADKIAPINQITEILLNQFHLTHKTALGSQL